MITFLYKTVLTILHVIFLIPKGTVWHGMLHLLARVTCYRLQKIRQFVTGKYQGMNTPPAKENIPLNTASHRDIKGYTKNNSVLEPLRVYRGHTAVVEDIAWKPDTDNIFASVGDDRQLILYVSCLRVTSASSSSLSV